MDDFEAQLALSEAEFILRNEALLLAEGELAYQDTVTYATGLLGCGSILVAAGVLAREFKVQSNLLHITIDNIEAPLVITGGMVAITGLVGLIGAKRIKKQLK